MPDEGLDVGKESGMATQNPFETVTPQQWVERTKVSGFARRPDTLKKIDQLYDLAHGKYAFYRFHTKFPTPGKEAEANRHRQEFRNILAQLLTAFDRYLEEHQATANWRGPDGKDLHRNELSRGLMKQTYDFIRDFLGPQQTVPQHDSRHTRAGVLFLLGHTHASVNTWSVASAAVNIGTTGLGKVTSEGLASKVNSGLNAAVNYKQTSTVAIAPTVATNPKSKSGGGVLDTLAGLYEKVLAAVKSVANSVSEFLQVRDASFYSALGSLIRAATEYVVGILTKAAPIVGAALDIGQGFVKICSAAMNYLATKRERSHFLLVPGHPAFLAQRIEQAMKYDITDGLIQVCKGVASAVAGAASGGLGSILTEAVVAIVNFFRRYFEAKKIETFCQKAAVELTHLKDLGYNLGSAEANKGKTFGKLIEDADEFGEFYQEGVNASVCIPILTLNSGICGDLMQMIRMYDAKNDVITQESFDAATRYFQRLKLWGCQYIQKSGIRFTSSYQNVQNLLHHAVYGHQGRQSTMQQVMTVAAG